MEAFSGPRFAIWKKVDKLILATINRFLRYINENLSEWFVQFLKDELKITDTIELETIHRMGRYDNREGSRARDIIMVFKKYQDKIKVMSNRKELGKNRIDHRRTKTIPK